MEPNEKYNQVEYLGDSVYIGLDKQYGQLYIFTYNGGPGTLMNEICLEETVVGNLIEFLRNNGYKY